MAAGLLTTNASKRTVVWAAVSLELPAKMLGEPSYLLLAAAELAVQFVNLSASSTPAASPSDDPAVVHALRWVKRHHGRRRDPSRSPAVVSAAALVSRADAGSSPAKMLGGIRRA